jgi:hypothetical protein
VEDVLAFKEPARPGDIFLLQSLAGQGVSLEPLAGRVPGLPESLSGLTLRKRFQHGPQGWSLASLEASH